MGRLVNMASNPLMNEEDGPATFILPSFPWDVALTPSVPVTLALCDASRAIGRLEGARRWCGPRHQSALVLASFEGWACLLASDRKVSWRAIGKAFADPDLVYRRATTDSRIAARLIGFHTGLSGFMDRSMYTGVVFSPLCAGESVSPRFRFELEQGTDDWLEHGEGFGLVRAILVMMSMAASDPDSDMVAVNSRALLPWTARYTLDSDLMVPISAGFIGRRDEWDVVARALSEPDGYDPDTVNRAIELSLRAVERAAIAAVFEIEMLHHRGTVGATAEWLHTMIPSVRNLFYVVNALPPVSSEQLRHLTDLSARGVKKAVRILEDQGVVIVEGRERGSANFVVRSAVPWKPYPRAAQFYQSVSAASEGQR